MLNSPDNSPYEDHAPNLTTDGHWLFFHSGRKVESGGNALYMSTRPKID